MTDRLRVAEEVYRTEQFESPVCSAGRWSKDGDRWERTVELETGPKTLTIVFVPGSCEVDDCYLG